MKIRAIVVFTIVVLLVISLASGSILLWRLFFFSLLILVVGYLWTRLSIRSLVFNASRLPERCQAGEWLEQSLTARNAGKLPALFIKFIPNTDLPGKRYPATLALPPRSSWQWQSKLYCEKRGRYGAGIIIATVSDPVGVFKAHRKFGEQQDVIVCPRTVELPFFSPFRGGDSGDGAKRWLGTASSSNAARVREWANGDSLNRIHWRTTAHTGQLMVKVFDPDRSRASTGAIWVVVDMENKTHLVAGDDSSEEYCVTITASLVKKYTDACIPVGLISAGDQECYLAPDVGSTHFWRIMETLGLLKATGSTPIEHVITNETKRLVADSVLVLVTPSVSPMLVNSLRNIAGRGVTTVAILLDRSTFGGDGNTGQVARRLTANDIQTHIVKRGQQFSVAMDSRGAIYETALREK